MNKTRSLPIHLGLLTLLAACPSSDPLAGTTDRDGGSLTATPTDTSTATASTTSTVTLPGTSTATSSTTSAATASTPALDLLFVVDNSPDTVLAQNALGARVGDMLYQLKQLSGGLPDLHVAVISSDLGAGAANLPGNCSRPGGDQGHFLMRQECGGNGSAYLTTSGAGGITDFANLTDKVSCMVRLGNEGCGFEQPLESVRRALSSSNPFSGVGTGLAGFVRPNALLGIVMVTNEDDCSASETTDLFSENISSEVAGLRCARAGHVCQLPMPSPLLAPWVGGPLSTCTANDSADMPLIRVSEIATAIRALKPNPDKQIVVAGVFGWPVRAGSTGSYAIKYNTWSEGQADRLSLAPVCIAGAESGLEAARMGFPSLRLKAFVEHFARGSMFSICDDLDQVYASIASNLALALR